MSDLGKVLVGVQVPKESSDTFEQFLKQLAYPYEEETENPVYKEFLHDGDIKS